MFNSLNITELDFTQIKGNIIDYFKNVKDIDGNATYADYDFSGSSLNTLVDVLAYNTHYNAMLAHMAVNESFIDSAQIRSNVVAAAKPLGYIPRSASSSVATINISCLPKVGPTIPSSIFMEKDTLFKTVGSSDQTYYYSLNDGITLTLKDNRYVNEQGPISIYEGRRVTKRFQVNGLNSAERYVIEDTDIDISSLIVRVYANVNDKSSIQIYSRFDDIVGINEQSNIYFINENSLGKYELQFGNGIVGSRLSPLNIIELEYRTTLGSAANGSRGFFSLANSGGIDISSYTTSCAVTVVSPATNGGDRDSIERIRENATSGFITQNRAVTADDYKSIIYSNFQDAKSVSVWGGEDNDPPQFGKVFISVNTSDDGSTVEYASDSLKNEIQNVLASKKILSIIPEIVDVEHINIVLDVLFKYNSNLTSVAQGELENQIRQNVVAAYNESHLNSFEKVFRYSNFTREIDSYSPAILNSHVRVFVSKDIDVDPTSRDSITVKYGTALTVDDGVALAGYISDVPWTYLGQPVYLKDKEDPSNSDRRILYAYVVNADGSIQQVGSNIAVVALSTGILTLNPLQISDVPIKLSIDLIPESNDIVSRRNQLIRIDAERCSVQGFVDSIVVGGGSRSIQYQTFKRDR